MLEYGPYHGNKGISARSAKGSAKEDDNFIFSIQVKEQSRKTDFFYRLVRRKQENMNADPFASSTFSLILAWLSAMPVLIATFTIPFAIFGKELKGNRFLFIWFGICLLFLSPVRYLLFQFILGSSYIFQSWAAFISTLLLALYVPIVFAILYFIGVGLPFLTASLILGKADHISFDKGIITAIIFPMICLISTYIFCLILPYAAWTVYWLNPKDVIKATNGPGAIVYRYVAAPLSPTMVPDIFVQTPQRDIDLLRCHVATTYMSNQKFWYFVKLQYPDIYEEILRKKHQ